MKIITNVLPLIVLSMLLFPSCKKDAIANSPTTQDPPTVAPPTAPPSGKDSIVVVPPPSSEEYDRIIDIGPGSGNLVIDGVSLSLKCKDLIRIKGGTYNGITIKNIISSDGCPITIKNDGLVQIVGNNSMVFYNLKNVIVSGNGTPGISKGFLLRDNPYRAVAIDGAVNNFTFQHVEFKNIANLVISIPFNSNYTGAEDSYLKNLKFLNISCDNTNQFIGSSGSVEKGSIKGLIKNIEIAYVDFKNSPNVGEVVYLGNVENYNVHHNKIDNINTNNNKHNGIFLLCGNGQFHNNYVSNHQGNAIRAHAFSVGSTPKDVLIYNNIVINSRKYSAFEVQGFAQNITAGATTFVNAKVFNNTCGNLNTSNDWVGGVVDVYTLIGGKCDVFNNLGFNFQDGSGIMNQQGDLLINTSNNLYFKTSKDAGILDESSLKLSGNSSAKQKGITPPFMITDYYGTSRGATLSIGAVE